MPAPLTVIRLSVSKTLASQVSPGMGGNALTVTVTEAENIDPKIFIYQKDVDSEFSPENADIFYAVASVAQLASLPPDAGSADEPFFRLNTMEVVFETAGELETFLNKQLDEILRLQRANDVMIDPDNAEIINIEITEGAVTVIP